MATAAQARKVVKQLQTILERVPPWTAEGQLESMDATFYFRDPTVTLRKRDHERIERWRETGCPPASVPKGIRLVEHDGSNRVATCQSFVEEIEHVYKKNLQLLRQLQTRYLENAGQLPLPPTKWPFHRDLIPMFDGLFDREGFTLEVAVACKALCSECTGRALAALDRILDGLAQPQKPTVRTQERPSGDCFTNEEAAFVLRELTGKGSEAAVSVLARNGDLTGSGTTRRRSGVTRASLETHLVREGHERVDVGEQIDDAIDRLRHLRRQTGA